MKHYFTNEDLPSDIKRHEVNILDNKFIFLTDNGVFSKDGIDFGSRLLLESIPLDELGSKVLDVGCGYGTFGIVINKLTGTYVDMVDVNKRAVHLANRNILENGLSKISAFVSDAYTDVSGKYDTIVTNPPIRAGKKKVYEILMKAKDHLKDNGKLFLVIRKEQGAKSTIKDLEKIYKVEVLERKKGFYIIKCSF